MAQIGNPVESLWSDCELYSTYLRQEPTPEVEVTEAMTKAGVIVFLSSDRSCEELDEILPRVYRAMEQARRNG